MKGPEKALLAVHRRTVMVGYEAPADRELDDVLQDVAASCNGVRMGTETVSTGRRNAFFDFRSDVMARRFVGKVKRIRWIPEWKL